MSATIDAVSGYIYVTHGGDEKILVFSNEGKYIDSWGSTGIGNGQFKRAVSVVFGNEDRMYVVDKDKSEIQIFKVEYQNEPIEGKKTVTKTITTRTRGDRKVRSASILCQDGR